jgi:hypothetical protein
MSSRSGHRCDVTAKGVEQQHVTTGAPTGQPCIHGGTGIFEPARPVLQCAETEHAC